MTFTNYGNDRFVKVEVDDLNGPQNLVDLKLTFSRKVEVGESRVVRLVYARS